MKPTRTDADLMQYHHTILGKPEIEKRDIQALLDAYREKYDVDLVFVAEQTIDRYLVELTYVSCRNRCQSRIEKQYFGDINGENAILFDDDGLCSYGFSPYDGTGENSILHYGLFQKEEYIGSVGMLNFREKRQWTEEERLAVQRLGRGLKSVVHLNHATKINLSGQDMIHQQEHALEAFFATTNCGILLHTLDGNKIISANKATLQLLDFNTLEDMEQNFHMVAPSVVEEDQKKLKAAIRRLKKAGDHENVGYRVRHKNGNILNIMGQIKLLEMDGELICQRVLMDCTEQRLREGKRNREEALNRAENASQAKTNFLNNMSHDIRTPMNAIIGYTTLAKNHFGNQVQVREYLDKISTASNHLLGLINDILDMSRIESGKLCLNYDPCSLPEILQELDTVMSGQMADRHHTFLLEIKNLSNETVLCDKLRLSQVLINLLGNAVKFTPDGGTIRVLLEQFPDSERDGFGKYRFCIKDNGIGMSEEIQEHLFEQFSREKSNTVNEIPGTGLGMAITKRIVDLMEGQIFVKSRLNEGTEFIIELEFAFCDPADFEAHNNCIKPERPLSLKSRNLLLAEDNLINQEIAAELLSDAGFVVDIANNGKEAVEIIRQSQPGYYAAVLMDVQMPVMNGYEATEQIRLLENPHLAGIPIIAMTANAFEEDKRNALNAGMNHFVSKPIDVAELLHVLSSITEVCA